MDEPVFVIVEVTQVLDAETFSAYQRRAREQIQALGGSVVARGGRLVEGVPAFAALMVQRWSSERAFQDWQGSEAYRPLKELRHQSAVVRMAVVPLMQLPA